MWCNMVLTILIKHAEHGIRRLEIDVPLQMNKIRRYSKYFIVVSGDICMRSRYVATSQNNKNCITPKICFYSSWILLE